MIRTAHLLLLSALLASCGEKKAAESGDRETQGKAGRAGERRSRDAEEEPDPRVTLRANYDAALATEDAAKREKALEQVAWDGIDVDAELSREAFGKLASGGEARQRLAGHFAMRLAETDPARAIEWAKELDEGERGEALGRVAVVISAKEPERAAKLIAEHLPAGAPRDRAVVQVLQRWGQSEPAAATEWAGDFDAGEARSAGLKVTIAAWMARDASAAARWIGEREDAALRMEALVGAAEYLRTRGDQPMATRLAAFEDPEIRGQLEKLLAQPQP